ncbi:hypothetical protein BKA69DRAFT_1037909, partial [Paraphysoderma sedebokerense]
MTDSAVEVCDMIKMHYHRHPLVPTNNRTLSSEQIWTSSVKELYNFCFRQNLPDLFRYLWKNWYRPERWRWWARSSNAQAIPLSRTTMLVESLWSSLKRNFLYRFPRPRMDFLIYIMITRFLPDLNSKYEGILTGTVTPSWKRAFTKEWRRLAKIPINSESYNVNMDDMFCSCFYFIQHKYFICKHLVQKVNRRLRVGEHLDDPNPESTNSNGNDQEIQTDGTEDISDTEVVSSDRLAPHHSLISRHRKPPFLKIINFNASPPPEAPYRPPQFNDSSIVATAQHQIVEDDELTEPEDIDANTETSAESSVSTSADMEVDDFGYETEGTMTDSGSELDEQE